MVFPRQPRPALLEAFTGRVLVSSRPRRTWGTDLFLLVWLTGWVIGEVFALVMIVGTLLGQNDEPIGTLAFFLLWISIWTLGGVAAGSALLYNLAGRETVTLDEEALELRQAVGPFGRTNRYTLEGIRDVRPVPDGKDFKVAFTHGKTRVRFGERLDRAGAEELVRTLTALVPLQPPVAVPEAALKTFSFGPTQLEIHRGIGRLGWTRHYDRTRIRNIRAVPVDTEDGPSDEYFQVAFDYGRRKVRLGGHLSLGEAEALARDLRERMLLNPG